MVTLLDQFIKSPPRESSGSSSANRFAYQHSWAVCRLLDLHASGVPYIVMLDFHDDIVILNDEANPTLAEFVQIKTKKSGQWTETMLLSRKWNSNKSERLPSHLGKLRQNELTFNSCVDRMTFVSNAAFNLTLKTGPGKDRETFCLNEMDDVTRQRFRDKLAEELGQKTEGESKTHLQVTPLSLDDHEVHALGRVVNFLSSIGLTGVNPAVLHRMLYGEVRRRSGCEKSPATVDELKRKVAISRSAFEGMLETANSQGDSFLAVIESIRGRLNTESLHSFR